MRAPRAFRNIQDSKPTPGRHSALKQASIAMSANLTAQIRVRLDKDAAPPKLLEIERVAVVCAVVGSYLDA